MFLVYCGILALPRFLSHNEVLVEVLVTQRVLSKQIFVKGVIESLGLHMKELCTLAFVELSSVVLKFSFSCM